MNIDRIKALQAQIKKFGSINMGEWQAGQGGGVSSIEEFHSCGNVACIAGHMAVLPEFQASGGESVGGIPVFGRNQGEEALEVWLGITEREARLIVYNRPAAVAGCLIAGKKWEKWNSEDAVKVLDMLMSGEIAARLKDYYN